MGYEMGCCFKDEIVPHAVRWYTGEAYGSDDEEDSEDDEDYDSEEDDDEDEEEEEEEADDEKASKKGKGKKGKKGARRASRSAAVTLARRSGAIMMRVMIAPLSSGS